MKALVFLEVIARLVSANHASHVDYTGTFV